MKTAKINLPRVQSPSNRPLGLTQKLDPRIFVTQYVGIFITGIPGSDCSAGIGYTDTMKCNY